MVTMDLKRRELEQLGQLHVLKFHDQLDDEQQKQLETDIKEVDWQNLNKIYTKQVLPQTEGGNKVKPASKIDDNLLEELPADCIEGTTRCSPKTLEDYRLLGLTFIGQGKVAALLLAGGQGTRLGVDYPKGMYDVGLPNHKSLFQLQAERILELNKSSGASTNILWYIMVSGPTMEKTKAFFESNKYFGHSRDNIIFFAQNSLPCLSFDGKVLLEDRHKLSRSPNGNGGLYEVLHEKGVIDHMVAHGVDYVHVYCVDNVLTKVCDPIFMGYCISKQVDIGAKAVEKVLPNEAVGTICKVNNQFKVIEYSEISDSIAQKRNESTGKLVFNSGNICEHFFRVNFLKVIKGDKVLPYHLAIKKIPHISLETSLLIIPTEPNGIKLEKFIFDVFGMSDKFAVWEVKREDEFSPLKNGPDKDKDNPKTALKALLRAYELNILTS